MHWYNTDLLSEQAPLENAVEERVLVGVQHCLLRAQQPEVHSSRTTLADDERNQTYYNANNAKVPEAYRLLGARPRLPPPAKIGAIPV